MKTTFLPFALSTAVCALLLAPAHGDPAAPAASAPVVTTTDNPAKVAPAPVAGTQGQTHSTTQPNTASPTGEVKNMAPVRGNAKEAEPKAAPKLDTSSASGLTVPGASSGSSLGSGSNSTLGNEAKPDTKPPVKQ